MPWRTVTLTEIYVSRRRNVSKQVLLWLTSRKIEIKTKINKWDLIKLKRFYTEKETTNKVKRQLSELDKIIAKITTGKELISKI